MSLSVFDLFKIGIGPSSSHTVGPMWAAHRFVLSLDSLGLLERVGHVRVFLYGSLALTGLGHATDKAVLLGLAGEVPDRVDPDVADAIVARIRERSRIALMGRHEVPFDEAEDLVFRMRETMIEHPNGMRFRAYDADREALHEEVYFSVGGGFVLSEEEAAASAEASEGNVALPYPFGSGEELLEICRRENASIAEIVRRNELALRREDEVVAGLDRVWEVMEGCILRGCRETGELPGGLRVRRRAGKLHQELRERPEAALRDNLTVLDWVNLYALAVNEENAAGGRVVTAPTNGAAGVIPAVLGYYMRFVPGSDRDGLHRFLLTAAAIGMLYKKNASISAAEVGCQGRWVSPARWRLVPCARSWAAATRKWRTPPRSAWSTISASPATRSAGWCRSPASSATPWARSRRSTPLGWRCAATGEHHVSASTSVIETMRQTGLDMSGQVQGNLAPAAWPSTWWPADRDFLPATTRNEGTTQLMSVARRVTAMAAQCGVSSPRTFADVRCRAAGERSDEEFSRQDNQIELIASENIVSKAVMRGSGHGADQQVRRGLSGPVVTTAAASTSTSRRGAGDRARQANCSAARIRQRAAALRRPGQRRRDAGADCKPGDTVLGMVAGRRRSPDPRCPPGAVRQVVQRGAVRRVAGHPGRHRSTMPSRSLSSPANIEPKLIIAGGSADSAYPRFRAFPRHRRQGRRLPDGGHGAHRRPGRHRRPPGHRCPTPTWSPLPPTRPCAVPVAA